MKFLHLKISDAEIEMSKFKNIFDIDEERILNWIKNQKKISIIEMWTFKRKENIEQNIWDKILKKKVYAIALGLQGETKKNINI